MESSSPSPRNFAEDFELVEFPDGALLVDLTTGAYFYANETAALIWHQLIDTNSPEQAACALARRYTLAPATADQAVRDLLASVTNAPPPPEPPGPLRYRPTDWGYRMDDNGKPTLEINKDGTAIRLVAPEVPSREVLTDWVRWMAPKILSLQGVMVLHASACEFESGLVAFCGQSGAGKTTTAKAFAEAGRRIISEDLLVLEASPTSLHAIAEGEPRIRLWAASTANSLAQSPLNALPSASLLKAKEGTFSTLSATCHVDALRRKGTKLQVQALRAHEAFVELLSVLFLGADDTSAWRSHISACAGIARRALHFGLTVPDTVDGLRAAARTLGLKPPRLHEAERL